MVASAAVRGRAPGPPGVALAVAGLLLQVLVPLAAGRALLRRGARHLESVQA